MFEKDMILKDRVEQVFEGQESELMMTLKDLAFKAKKRGFLDVSVDKDDKKETEK